jgi:hypothetical protein
MLPVVNMKILAQMANLTYQPTAVQNQTLSNLPGVKSFHVLDTANNKALGIDKPDTGTLVTTVETDGALIVAVRGTSPEAMMDDLKDDTDGAHVPNVDGSGKVRKGFDEATQSIWPQLSPIIQEAIAKKEAVHIVGHSLGAAVAILTADQMNHDMGVKPESVFAIECPGVGPGTEKTHLEKVGLDDRTLRVVNNTDPIPRALPGDPPIGAGIYFNHKGLAQSDDGHHTWDILEGQTEHILHGKMDVFQDHHLEGILPLMYDPRNQAAMAAVSQQMNAAEQAAPSPVPTDLH